MSCQDVKWELRCIISYDKHKDLVWSEITSAQYQSLSIKIKKCVFILH